MFCKFCGKETAGRFIYCPFCGKNQNEVVESISQDEDSKSTKGDIKVEPQNIERSENKASKASDTNAIVNVIYVSKEPKFQYALALIIMSIVLLIWRIDFILSIPILLVIVLLSDVLLKLVGPVLPTWPANKDAIKEMMLIKIAILTHLESNDIDELQRRLGSSYGVSCEQDGSRVCIENKRCVFEVCYNVDNTFSVQIKEKKIGLWINPVVEDYIKIVNQIQMLCNKGVPHSELKPVTITQKKKEFRDYIWIVVEAVICIITVGLMLTRDHEYRVIETVKSVKMSTNLGSDYTNAYAFEKYCDETGWDYYKANGEHVVFKGKCTLPGGSEKGNLTVDWVIDGMGVVAVQSLKFNGNELENYERIPLLAAVFEYDLPNNNTDNTVSEAPTAKSDSNNEDKSTSNKAAKPTSTPTPTPNEYSNVLWSEWNGGYDEGWLDTWIEFSCKDGSVKINESCGYIEQWFRGMGWRGNIVYLGDNAFSWTIAEYLEGNSASPFQGETYIVYLETEGNRKCLDIYNSDTGSFEVRFYLQ